VVGHHRTLTQSERYGQASNFLFVGQLVFDQFSGRNTTSEPWRISCSKGRGGACGPVAVMEIIGTAPRLVGAKSSYSLRPKIRRGQS